MVRLSDDLFRAFWKACEVLGTRRALQIVLEYAQGTATSVMETLLDEVAGNSDPWKEPEERVETEEDAEDLRRGYADAGRVCALLEAARALVEIAQG